MNILPRTDTLKKLHELSATANTLQKRFASTSQFRMYHYVGKCLSTHCGAPFILQLAITQEQAMARQFNSTFSTLRLTSQDEKDFTKWVTAQTGDTLALLNTLGGSGFKFSASYVFDQNAWCFSLIGTDNTKLHKNMVMTSWSDDLAEAIYMAAYKHIVLCNEGEWPSQEQGNRWG